MLSAAPETLKQLWVAGLDHFRQGRLAEAEMAFARLLQHAPDHAGARYNRAVTLKALGRTDEAAEEYRRTLKLDPANAKAHNNLGVILADLGQAEPAAAHYRQALALQPDFASAHYNLANLLRDNGELVRAVDHYRRALALTPDDADTHNNLGQALAAQGRFEEAEASYRRALALRPGDGRAQANLGAALSELGRLDEALAQGLRAVEVAPEDPNAHFNLAHVLDRLDRVAEAEGHYRIALALDPEHAEAHHNLGFLAQQQGRLDEALARYARAQALKPDYGDAQWNEGLARLVVGEFEAGWLKYESRWRRPGVQPRSLAAPLWDGGPLAGRTILLHAEQGLGDAIQFVRYAALVKALGATVVLECPPSQRRLFEGLAGVDRLISSGEPLPPVDVHAPLLSLPMLMGTRLDSVPALPAYLAPEPALAAAWRERLTHLRRPKVGLVWRGNPRHPNDRRRSAPPSVFAGLAGRSDVDWVSLQLDAQAEELAALGDALFDAGPLIGDYADTAALVAGLDLVVTVDTSVAHLAGALGRPVWLMLPFAPDWRWLLYRTDSPWYPTMRLFRQRAPGDWDGVAAEVGRALDARLAGTALPSPSPPRPAPAPLPPALVVSHERSGTHFLMNALSFGFGYTAQPWVDLDAHAIDIDYADPDAIAQALEARAGDPLDRIVKSHHAAGIFGPALERVAARYAVICINRHPVETMLSLWRHLNGLAWDEGPKLADPLALARAAPSGRMTRYQAAPAATMLQRWAQHAEGWLDAAEANPRIRIVRYGDLDRRYAETLSGLSDLIGRPPLSPLLRPPRDVNVIAMGRTGAEAPVSPAVLSALHAYCLAEAGPLMARLGYA